MYVLVLVASTIKEDLSYGWGFNYYTFKIQSKLKLYLIFFLAKSHNGNQDPSEGRLALSCVNFHFSYNAKNTSKKVMNPSF